MILMPLSADVPSASPQLNASVRVIPHVGVEIGGGYRVSGATDALDDRLNGVNGSRALQLTW